TTGNKPLVGRIFCFDIVGTPPEEFYRFETGQVGVQSTNERQSTGNNGCGAGGTGKGSIAAGVFSGNGSFARCDDVEMSAVSRISCQKVVGLAVAHPHDAAIRRRKNETGIAIVAGSGYNRHVPADSEV